MSPGIRTASILVACGRIMTCELISHALERQAGHRVVATATSLKDALEGIRANSVNLALVTPTLCDGPISGLLLLQEIQANFPNVKTILLFEQPEEHLIGAAFRAGARGVLSLSDAGFEMLRKCVVKVHAGEVWANSAQLVHVLSALSLHAPLRVLNADGVRLLTKREEDVVRLVEDGLTNRQIARELRLSEHTIRNNLFRIFDKLGVSTRVELALYAINRSKPAVTPGLTSREEEAPSSE